VVEGFDFEFEVFLVAEAVGLAFEHCDRVVGVFEGTGRDRVIVPGKDAGSIDGQGAGEGCEHEDAARLGLTDPVVEEAASGLFVRLFPQQRQVFLKAVGGDEVFVESQGLLQTFRLVASFVEVFWSFERQPASVFDNVLVQPVGALAIQVSPQVGQLVFSSLTMWNQSITTAASGRFSVTALVVRRRHVYGHRLDGGVRGFEPFPEAIQGLSAFAFYVDHRAALNVHHNSEILVAFLGVHQGLMSAGLQIVEIPV